jgi:hypothetical protein
MKSIIKIERPSKRLEQTRHGLIHKNGDGDDEYSEGFEVMSWSEVY